MKETQVVQTSSGAVCGYKNEEGMRYFLGIPYGKAERFCPAEPVRWDGVLDCREYRGKALQPNRLGEYPAGEEICVAGTEDCLFLNIWAPEQQPGEHLPVVIYIHGGAFQVGSAQETSRAGDRFMEKDRMIFVSVGYRLGVMGFLQLGESMGEKYSRSGSCGALDVLSAVEWVHQNIAAFGGDPKRITLFGISAGAKLIGSLLTVPRMKELCTQVILESGAMQSFRTRKTARIVAEEYEKVLGVQDKGELLRLPAEKLMIAQARFCDTPGSTCFFGPVLEDPVFDPAWLKTLQAGDGWRGRAILGSGLRELAGTAARPDFLEKKELLLRNLFGTESESVKEQAESLSAQPDTEVWTKVLSDRMYRSYTDLLAERLTDIGCPVWVYSFEVLPAVHGMGFGYLMGEVDRYDVRQAHAETGACRMVSDQMRRMIRQFICTGTPADPEEWPEYQGGQKRVFSLKPHVEVRPDDSLRDVPEMVYQR